jgi:hypothetical protein
MRITVEIVVSNLETEFVVKPKKGFLASLG